MRVETENLPIIKNLVLDDGRVLTWNEKGSGQLGSGAHSRVFAGAFGKDVSALSAVKVFKYDLDKGFDIESKTLSELKHPNLIASNAIFATQGLRVISTELCELGMLHSELNKSENYFGMSQYAYRNLFEDLTSAVEYMWQQNSFHRDIKPANILMTVQGDKKVYKLGDFDTTRNILMEVAEGIDVRLCSLRGTPDHAHPAIMEKVDKMKKADKGARMDKAEVSPETANLWSIYTTLFECAVGYVPFFSEVRPASKSRGAIESGRQNGDISGIEYRKKNGELDIDYEQHLPNTTRLSRAHRSHLERLFANMISKPHVPGHQSDKDKKSFDTESYRSMAKEFLSKSSVVFFSVKNGEYITALAKLPHNGKYDRQFLLDQFSINSESNDKAKLSFFFNGKKLDGDIDAQVLASSSLTQPILVLFEDSIGMTEENHIPGERKEITDQKIPGSLLPTYQSPHNWQGLESEKPEKPSGIQKYINARQKPQFIPLNPQWVEPLKLDGTSLKTIKAKIEFNQGVAARSIELSKENHRSITHLRAAITNSNNLLRDGISQARTLLTDLKEQELEVDRVLSVDQSGYEDLLKFQMIDDSHNELTQEFLTSLNAVRMTVEKIKDGKNRLMEFSIKREELRANLDRLPYILIPTIDHDERICDERKSDNLASMNTLSNLFSNQKMDKTTQQEVDHHSIQMCKAIYMKFNGRYNSVIKGNTECENKFATFHEKVNKEIKAANNRLDYISTIYRNAQVSFDNLIALMNEMDDLVVAYKKAINHCNHCRAVKEKLDHSQQDIFSQLNQASGNDNNMLARQGRRAVVDSGQKTHSSARKPNMAMTTHGPGSMSSDLDLNSLSGQQFTSFVDNFLLIHRNNKAKRAKLLAQFKSENNESK